MSSSADPRAAFTTSGTFVVGDFLRVGRSGFELKEKARDERPGAGAGSTSTTANSTPTTEASCASFAWSALSSSPSSPAKRQEQQREMPPPDSPIVVRGLDELRVLEDLGRGAGGFVRKVIHTPTGTVMAQKAISIELAPQKVKEIVAELRALATGDDDNNNIVRSYGALAVENKIFLMLEFMDGGSLADIVAHIRTGIPEKYLACVARQVLRGLRHLHANHIIHRDIKPSNILVNRAGDVKLADFGVSGRMESDSRAKKETFVGTLTYMSPERIEGKAHSYDSDLWSLGLTLLECAVARYPYLTPGQHRNRRASDLGFWDVVEKVVRDEPPRAPCKRFSAEFADFVGAMLQKEPGQRAPVEQLLEHPFLVRHADLPCSDLGAWIRAALKHGTRNRPSKEERRGAVLEARDALLSIQKRWRGSRDEDEEVEDEDEEDGEDDEDEGAVHTQSPAVRPAAAVPMSRPQALFVGTEDQNEEDDSQIVFDSNFILEELGEEEEEE